MAQLMSHKLLIIPLRACSFFPRDGRSSSKFAIIVINPTFVVKKPPSKLKHYLNSSRLNEFNKRSRPTLARLQIPVNWYNERFNQC